MKYFVIIFSKRKDRFIMGFLEIRREGNGGVLGNFWEMNYLLEL
jgi:hypothetical protein